MRPDKSQMQVFNGWFPLFNKDNKPNGKIFYYENHAKIKNQFHNNANVVVTLDNGDIFTGFLFYKTLTTKAYLEPNKKFLIPIISSPNPKYINKKLLMEVITNNSLIRNVIIKEM